MPREHSPHPRPRILLHHLPLFTGVRSILTFEVRAHTVVDSDMEFTVRARSSIFHLRNPFKVRCFDSPRASIVTLPPHLDSGLGLSVSSLGDVPSGDEEGGGAAQLIYPPEVPQTEPGVECSVVSGDQTSTFRDTPTPSLSSEASAF